MSGLKNKKGKKKGKKSNSGKKIKEPNQIDKDKSVPLKDDIPKKSSFFDYKVEHEFPKIGEKVFTLKYSRL